MKNREKEITKISFLGIIINVLLASFKLIIGIISKSITIILDSINNYSDVLSSLITIIGIKLSSKGPDKDHPLGHGRYEYLSAMLISALILYAGISSFVEAIKKIIKPLDTSFSLVSFIILIISIITKIILGLFIYKKSKEINSPSLELSGKDALFDGLISFSVLISAILYVKANINIEAYLALVIALIIIKSGIEMFKETINEILGKRIHKDIKEDIIKTIKEEELVEGVYDLVLHNYGPDKYVGSVHIAIPDYLNAKDIDILERKIAKDVEEKHQILLTGIGIYAININDKKIKTIHDEINKIVYEFDGVIQTHGFHIDEINKTIYLDIILDFDVNNRDELFKEIVSKVKKKYPKYELSFKLDLDI